MSHRLQFAYPVLQFRMHCWFMHMDVEFGRLLHEIPHPPQFCGLFRLTSHPFAFPPGLK
jgi:hypothetical protein